MLKRAYFLRALIFLIPVVAVYYAIFLSGGEMKLALFLGLSGVAGGFSLFVSLLERRSEKHSLNLISDKLTESAVKIEKLAISNADSALELKNSMTNSSRNILLATSTIDEINAMADKNEENIEQFKQISNKGLESVEDKRDAMATLFDKINSIETLNEAAENQVHQSLEEISYLLETVREIGNETSVINDIVFQTKLLSFNAAVESARAGEYGKGFAVVAEEIGNLAQMSGQASNSINRIVEENIEKIEGILNKNKTDIKRAMNSSSDLIKECVEQSKRSEEAVEEFNESFSQIALVAEQIAVATNEQSVGVREINKSVHNLNTESGKIVESVGVSSEVSNELKKEIENLSRLSSNIISFAKDIAISEIDVMAASGKLSSHTFIDVRRPEEWSDPELGHIKGAKLITLNDKFEKALAELDPDKKYVFVCRSGGRSMRATRIAQRLGFKHISNMQGGMIDWKKQELESITHKARESRAS